MGHAPAGPETGVLNCEAWRATASSALGHARRQEQLVAVVVVDIGHFKAVNDVFGHLAGDDVLVRTADAIVGCVRSTDLVCRFGGILDLPELMASADRALYRAKNDGRNRVTGVLGRRQSAPLSAG